MTVIARMNIGGPAVLVSHLVRSLSPEGYDHRLYTGWCAADEADFLLTQATDIDVIRVDGLGRAVRAGDDARALSRLVHEIRGFRPHIVHTHTAKAGVLGRTAVKLSGVRSATVHTFHGHLLNGYFSPGKTKMIVGLERLLASQTDALITVGPQVRDDLIEVGIGRPDQYSIIPPGLKMPTPRPRDDVRREFGLGTQAPVIAFIGRLTDIKRPDRFVQVVENVTRHRPDVRFVVAGSGDHARTLSEAAVTLPITMLGWRDDVENVLAASDAVILTSENEGTPLSLIEAGIAGLPVVATSVGSVPDVVIDGETGWLTDPTPDALTEATLQMLADPSEARRRGQAAQSRCEYLYGVGRMAEDHDKLYRNLAMRRATRRLAAR